MIGSCPNARLSRTTCGSVFRLRRWSIQTLVSTTITQCVLHAWRRDRPPSRFRPTPHRLASDDEVGRPGGELPRRSPFWLPGRSPPWPRSANRRRFQCSFSRRTPCVWYGRIIHNACLRGKRHPSIGRFPKRIQQGGEHTPKSLHRSLADRAWRKGYGAQPIGRLHPREGKRTLTDTAYNTK